MGEIKDTNIYYSNLKLDGVVSIDGNLIPRQNRLSRLLTIVFPSNGTTSMAKQKSFCLFCLNAFIGVRSRKCCIKLAMLSIFLSLMFLSVCSGQFLFNFHPQKPEIFRDSGVNHRFISFNPKIIPFNNQTHNESGIDSNLKKNIPSCIIFGVSKCGTRAVLEYLKLHPDVVAPNEEINFFNNQTLQKKGITWYIEQMPVSKPHQITVEKSPDYFQNHQCAELIFAAKSSMKLILLLRDPVERLVSQYMQLLEKRPSLPTFEEWVIDPGTGNINTKLPSVIVSAYSEHIVYWFSTFPKKQIHIMESGSLRNNPLEEMKRVEKFLNLRDFYQEEDFYYNSSRGFYCTRARSSGKTKCLGKSKGREHIQVNADILDKLYTFYKPYNENLNTILDTKFPWS